MEEAKKKKKLHIVVFPWLAFGHLLPFLELSKRLASRGHRVSFVSAPRNLARLPTLPGEVAPSIALVPLPPGAEATSDLPFAGARLLMRAYDALRPSLAAFLAAAAPDWVVFDYNDWLPGVADALGVRKAFFATTNAWCLSVVAPAPDSGRAHGHRRLAEAKRGLPDTHGVSRVTGLTLGGCDVVAIRSCAEAEMEPGAIHLLEGLHGKPVLPVGLLMPPFPRPGDGDEDEEEDAWRAIGAWLGQQQRGSVLYAALGSESTPTQDQLTELALGLEMSGSPFLWALRRPVGAPLELPGGFEGRVAGGRPRGMVWTGWAPQARILSHPSVGAFLSHCGWSSVLEGLGSGKPFVMLPFVLDQVLNADGMQGRSLGVKIPRLSDGSFARGSVAQAVREVLQQERAQAYRDEAQKMSRVVGDAALHDRYFDKFEQYLCDHRPTSAIPEGN